MDAQRVTGEKVVRIQKPSLGRIVRYVDMNNRMLPMIIDEVHSNNCVSGFVFNSQAGQPYSVRSVMEGTDTMQWSWPPRI